LLQVRNVVTCLEIYVIQQRGYQPLGHDLMDSGLHRFLCDAPLLRALKAARVSCVASRLDPFPLDLPDEPQQRRSSAEGAVSLEEPRFWVCHTLETLELGFKQPYTLERLRQLTSRDVRILKKWDSLLQQEQESIQRRKAYLEQGTMFRDEILNYAIYTEGLGGDPRHASDSVHSMSLLGTLRDVKDCMDEIARSKLDGFAPSTPRVVITGC
ncbi:hypothetical protein BG006_006204, partial [Podila minutissima]